MTFTKVTFKTSCLKPGSRDEFSNTMFFGQDYHEAFTDGVFLFLVKGDATLAYPVTSISHADVVLQEAVLEEDVPLEGLN